MSTVAGQAKRTQVAADDSAVDAKGVLSGESTLPQWRRIALERQLPHPRFPNGLGLPSTIMLICFLAIGAATAGYFMRPPARAVPHAVIESQQALVKETARRVSVGARRDRDDVIRIAGDYAAGGGQDPATFVKAAAAREHSWRTVAVWDPTSRRVLATAGEALPSAVLATRTGSDTAVGYVGTDRRGRLVHVIKLADGNMLGISLAMGIRNLRLEPSASQTVMFVLNGDTLIYSQGHPIDAADPVRAAVVRAVAAHATHTSQGRTVAMNGHRRVPVVSATPVDGTTFAVVSVTYAVRTGARSSMDAVYIGLSLALLALAGFLWVRFAFVRPLRRLLIDAKAVACGEFGGMSRESRLSEAHRVGAALFALSPQRPDPPGYSVGSDYPGEQGRPRQPGLRRRQVHLNEAAHPSHQRYAGLRAHLGRRRRRRLERCGGWLDRRAARGWVTVRMRTRDDGHSRRSRVGATTVVSVTAVTAVVWSVGLFTIVRDVPTVPAQIIADYQNHVDHAANALRDTFDTGLSNLQAFADANIAAAGDRSVVSGLLSSFVDNNRRFRSAYVLDRDGQVAALAGRAPLRHGGWAGTPAGLVLDSRTTTVPLVLAHVPYGTGQLVAEFDVISLRSVLDRVDGDVHVVDHQMRSMLDTGGYIPFRVIKDRDVRAAAAAALSPADANATPRPSGRVVAASVVGNDDTITAAVAGASTARGPASSARPGPGPGPGPSTETSAPSPAGKLGWVVVISRDAADLALPTTQAVHVAWLLMVLAITVAVVGWCWQYTIFVRPLRALAAAAERMTGGDRDTPLTPARFDEIGALAICLDVCRQAHSDGNDRLAGAARLRGTGQDYTVVMSTIKI